MGKVYLVGAGPGAPDLLTLRAARLLAQADIVFFDALVHRDTLALATNARLVDVGKRSGRASTEQRFTNRALVEAARTHATVVRLKGGDPMLFGRAQEEIDALKAAGVEFEVVPGITAATAASASLGISLTRRGVSRHVAFVTPRTGTDQQPTEWLEAAAAADTVALYMAASQSREVATQLIGAGRKPSTPVIFIENVSLANERRVPTSLDALRQQAAAPAFEGPVLMLVGEVFAEFTQGAMEHEAEMRFAVSERCRARSA